MTTIKEDAISVYAECGGYIARPVGNTRFIKGDKVKGHHFGGTPLHGIGKDATCKRGEYLETWLGCGTTSQDKTPRQRKKAYDWYMNYARTTYRFLFKEFEK